MTARSVAPARDAWILGDKPREHIFEPLGMADSDLPLPAGSGEAELLVAIERLRRQRLDLSRPCGRCGF